LMPPPLGAQHLLPLTSRGGAAVIQPTAVQQAAPRPPPPLPAALMAQLQQLCRASQGPAAAPAVGQAAVPSPAAGHASALAPPQW
jgi:hypothetical protein